MILAEFSSSAWVEMFKTIAVLGAAIMSYMAMRKGGQAVAKIAAVEEKVEVVHKATNSLVGKLVMAEKAASFGEGAKSEMDKLPTKEHS